MTGLEQFDTDIRTPQEEVLAEAEFVFPRQGIYYSMHTVPVTPCHEVVLFVPFEEFSIVKSYSARIEVSLGDNALTATVNSFQNKTIPGDVIEPTGVLLLGHENEWIKAIHPEIGHVDGYEAVIDACDDNSSLRAILSDGERVAVPAVSPVVPEYLAKRAIWELADDVKTGRIEFRLGE